MSFRSCFIIIAILFTALCINKAESYPSLNTQVAKLIKSKESIRDTAQIYTFIRNSGHYEQIKLIKGHIVIIYDKQNDPKDNLNTIQEIEKIIKMEVFAPALKYLENSNLQIGILLDDVIALTNNKFAGLNSLLTRSSINISHGIILFHYKHSIKYKISKIENGYQLEENIPLTTLLNEVYELIDSYKYENLKTIFTNTQEYQKLSRIIDLTLSKPIVSNHQIDFGTASPEERDQVIRSSSKNISPEWLMNKIEEANLVYADSYAYLDKLKDKRAAELAAKALTDRLHIYYPWAKDVVFRPVWDRNKQEFRLN